MPSLDETDPFEAITFGVAPDVTDELNGGVRYIRGSHLKGTCHHSHTSTLVFSQGITDYDEASAAAEFVTNTNPGDLLGHPALTIHRVDFNQLTDRHRSDLGFICYAARAKHDEHDH